ncbi:hypothetical protein BN1723_009172 [Verticillium longisporum]|uniref:Uncharacterized protein n=1 Tax=Verticillium longisporum TaxID=100787 RepID=A0A0G4KNB3_VERLO|nr:hypothetical protein BN1723_009172 [Verticillium longisporum]CRK35780.1 hypothetical protein BN1708_006794 [Verticillium longisporum]
MNRCLLLLAVGEKIGNAHGEDADASGRAAPADRCLQDRDEKKVVAAACQKAIDQAISKGAEAEDVSVVEINTIPLQYVDNGAMRIQIRAVGKLAVPKDGTLANSVVYAASDEKKEEQTAKTNIPDALDSTFKPSIKVDLDTTSLKSVMALGGGGLTRHEFLKSLDTLRKSEPGRLRIISPKSVKDGNLIYLGSWYRILSILDQDKPDGIFTDEIGGGNAYYVPRCVMFFHLAALNVHTSNLATLSVYGHPLTPCTLSDARGNVNMIMNTDTPFRLEKFLRTAAIKLGLGCAIAARPLPGSAIKAHGVPNTLSQA